MHTEGEIKVNVQPIKKIVTTINICGCIGEPNARQCPYVEVVRSGWFCNKSKMLIVIDGNLRPFNKIPKWCELEDA